MKWLGTTAWLACSVAAFGFFNAGLQSGSGMAGYGETCRRRAAETQSFSAALSIGGPLSLAASLAVTGFGYSGWTVKRRECVE